MKNVMLTAVLICIAGAASDAAVITWTGPTAVSSASDVSTEGVLVEAVNCYLTSHVASNTSPTVNGVLFTGSKDLLDQDYTSAPFDFCSVDTGDSGYNDLLSTCDFGGGGDYFEISLGGGNLVSGTDYLIQIWYVDDRAGYAGRVMEYGDGDGNGNTVQLTAGAVQYATGTFTADGTTQALSFDAIGFGNAHLTAYQIRESTSVPVPTLSTTASNPVSASFTVDIEFTEPVTGLQESDFSVINGSVSDSTLTGSGSNYSIDIVPAANGDVSVMLPAGSVTDTDGENNQNPQSNTLVILYLSPGSDQPSVVLSTDSSVVIGPYVVYIDFDEPVTGLETGDFVISNGTVSGLTGSDANYSIQVTPSSDGYVTISLPAGAVVDIDGDNLSNTASNELVTAYSGPIAVSIYGPLTSGEIEFDVYLTFSSAISGLEITDFDVTNGIVLSVTEQGRREFAGRYFIVSVRASSPGTVTISLPEGVVQDVTVAELVNASSGPFEVECTSDFMAGWVVDDETSWTEATDTASNLTIADGFAEPTANTAVFSSVIKTFGDKRQATAITFSQSPVWDNWTGVANVGASGAGDATVLLCLGDNDYYHLGLGNTGGYHAWHSTDMVNWTHRGPVTSGPEGRWVTTAEYKDGLFYIYSDYPNDHTPHLFIDDDLDDGIPGTLMGMAFNDPTHGSDHAVIRDNADGLFHIIHEDWTPINASTHSWDSPLAGHTSSADGFTGFEPAEHVPPIDFRTQPTGELGTYDHPHVDGTHISNPCYYEIHTPDQDAYGDWTAIKVGSQQYLFCDYDEAGVGIKVARFTSDSIYKQYERVGTLGSGHPDPTVGFAEGQFYLITQMSTDYISPGPWVDGVQARGGVDTDGNGTIDQWTGWQTISEQYNHVPGYARVVDVTPAKLDLSGLPEGYGFKFEFQIDNTVVSNVSPIMDRVEMNFQRPCSYFVAGDRDLDCDVDLEDFSLMSQQWLVNCSPHCDADLEYLAVLASNWLVNCDVDPGNPACIPVQ